MARTYRGEFRPGTSGSWLPLFDGESSPFYDWEWAGTIPPGEYQVRVQALDDGVPGPWSDHLVLTFAAPAGEIAQVHVLCGDVIAEAEPPSYVYGEVEASRWRFFVPGETAPIYDTGEITDPVSLLRGAALGVLPVSTVIEVSFAYKVAGVWSDESPRVAFTTRNCIEPSRPGYRLAHLELHTDIKAAGGERLAVTRRILAATEHHSLSPAEERLTVELPLDDELARRVVERMVLRPVMLNGTWSEWRVVKVEEGRDESNALTVQVEAEGIRYDLGNGVATRVLEDGSVQHQWEEFISLPEHVSVALADAPEHFLQGLVVDAGRPSYPGAPTLLTPVWFNHAGTPLEQLTQLAEQEGMEIEVTRRLADNIYYVHMVKERGASVPPVRLLHGRNLYAIRRSRDAEALVTRVYPFGPESDGWRQGMEHAQWEVLAVDVSSPGAHRIQLADGPIEFDGQFGGAVGITPKYLEVAGTSTRLEVVDTILATQEIVVADAEDVPVGALVLFRADADGTALTYLERPDALQEYGEQRVPVYFEDIPPVDNLVGNAYLADVGPGGLPRGFGLVGAPDITESTSELYTRYGGRSWVVDADEDEGMVSAWYPVAPTESRPYASSSSKVWVFSGTVRQTTRFRDAAGTVAEKTVNSGTLVNAWTDGDKGLYDAGIDIHDWASLSLTGPVTEFQVSLTAQGGAAVFAWDAVLLCQDAAPPEEFYDGLASNALFRLGNKHLREYGWRRYTYEVTPRDLHRIRPGEFPEDRFVLGGSVALFDPDIEQGAHVRVSEIQYDLLSLDGTSLRLDTRPATLLGTPRSRTHLPRRSAGAIGPPPGPAGTISGVTVAAAGSGQLRVRWDHNDVVQDADPGEFTVVIQSDDSVVGSRTAVSGRDPRLESGGTDSVALRGEYMDVYPICSPGWNCASVVRTYTVTLQRDGFTVDVGTASITVTMRHLEEPT